MTPVRDTFAIHWKIRILFPFLFLNFSGPGCSIEEETSILETPNILFILADDLGAMDVGYQGNDFYETPHIDALSREGVRFENAYAASPLCSATRASILTGWAPARQHLTGVTPSTRGDGRYMGFTDTEDWRAAASYMFASPKQPLELAKQLGQLPLSRITIAERLKEVGYLNGFIGKWHLGPDQDKYPQYQGFDVNIGGSAQGWSAKFDPYHLPELENREAGEYLTDRLTDEAIHFMENAVSDHTSFFCFLSYYQVHDPWLAKPADRQTFSDKIDPDGRHRNADYAGMVKNLDENVGRVLASLDEMGVAENTLVIFMSDNGGVTQGMKADGTVVEVTSNYPLRGGKAILREGGIRVPMIMRWPSHIDPNQIETTPVISTDLFPTLLDVAKLESTPGEPLDGVSLLPLVEGESDLRRRYLTWFMPHYIRAQQERMDPVAVIRHGDYRLVKFYSGNLELFDLSKDPGEEHNLVKLQAELARELEATLDTELASQNAYFPRPNPHSSGVSSSSNPDQTSR